MASTGGAIRRQLGRLAADFPTEADALRRRAFWRLATRFTPYLAVDREGMRLLVSTSDETIGRRLFVYHRTPELDIVRAFEALRGIPGLAARLRGTTIVEVGANIGSHTVELVRHYDAASVVAIEPNPENCELLTQNVLANGVADRVRLLPIALSDRDGAVELELSSDNSGDHRVRVAGAEQRGAEARRTTIEVRAARFDSIVDRGELDLGQVGLIWMDAQGHEAHILAGATRLLGSPIPIMMEYWPYGLRRANGLQALHELIAEHYSHVIDVSPPSGAARLLPSSQLPSLEREYGWAARPEDPLPGTDLILMGGLGAG